MTGESQVLLIDLCAVPGFPDTEPEAMTVSERSPSVLDLYSRRISCVAELPASTPCSSLRRSTTPTFKQRTPDLPPKLTSVTKRTPGDLQHRGPSTRAPYDPSHRHPVLGGRRHRRCSCAGPGRGSANRNDSIGSGRSDRSRDHAAPFGPVAMLLFMIASLCSAERARPSPRLT